MPEVLGNPPSPRVALFWNGTAWQWALVDAAGHLQIDTVTSALPAGAATEATLASADGYLGLIAVLWNCLRTVGTDRFMVKGEDQLFSYKGVLQDQKYLADAAAGTNTLVGSTVPAGEIWVVTNICVANRRNDSGYVKIRMAHLFDWPGVAGLPPLTKEVPACWTGHFILVPTQRLEAIFYACIVNDDLYWVTYGYRMTLET